MREENLSELVRLALTLPPGDATDTLRFKYTNVACELLTSDVVTILDALLASPPLMDRIYGFLEQPPVDRPANAICSGSSNSQSPAAPPKPARVSSQVNSNGDSSLVPTASSAEAPSAAEKGDATDTSEQEASIAASAAAAPADAHSQSQTDHADDTASPVASGEPPVSPEKPKAADELDLETSINPLMASFFSKILNQLLQRKTEKVCVCA